MTLEFLPYQLHFKTPFGVSSNIRAYTDTVLVRLGEETVRGYGEACLPPYLEESLDETVSFLEQAKGLMSEVKCLDNLEDTMRELDRLSPGNNAAKAAVDMALHDLISKKAGLNFCDYKNISFPAQVQTAFTVGISDEKTLKEKIEWAKDFSILKIKAGTRDDKALISFVRKFTQKPLYVDVNQGWKNEIEALRMLEWFENKNVMLVEQPLPAHQHKEMLWLAQRSPLPLYADESVKRFTDLEKMENAFHGVNIKLMKCTGLHEAIKMIGYCKQNNIKIMLGCMAETSCGTTAMAHLTSFADVVDLDAPLLCENDPFAGVEYKNGKMHLQKKSGFGLKIKDENIF